MKRIIGLLFIVLSLSCCSKSETDKEEGGNYVLSIAPQNLKFPANDDSQNVIVASNGQWSLSGGDSWCTPSITSGGNGANVTFSVEKTWNYNQEIRRLHSRLAMKRRPFM